MDQLLGHNHVLPPRYAGGLFQITARGSSHPEFAHLAPMLAGLMRLSERAGDAPAATQSTHETVPM